MLFKIFISTCLLSISSNAFSVTPLIAPIVKVYVEYLKECPTGLVSNKNNEKKYCEPTLTNIDAKTKVIYTEVKDYFYNRFNAKPTIIYPRNY